MREILLGLGANCPGIRGTPIDTLRHTVRCLSRERIRPLMLSPIYITPPIGGPAQSLYVNAVIRAQTALPPSEVLRVVKRLERAAGRRARGRWAARALDIDILDDPAARLGWRHRRDGARAGHRLLSPRQATRMTRSPPLSIPHPRLHVRAFVLLPLRDVAPHWRHPILGCSVHHLLARLGPQSWLIRRAPETWALPDASEARGAST